MLHMQEECKIQQVFYFEHGIGTSYIGDVVIVFVTDKGNYVRYYAQYPFVLEEYACEPVVFKEADFNKYAEEYFNYIIEFARENGNDFLGGPPSFLKFLELKENE